MNTTTPKNWTYISLAKAGELIMGQSPSGSSYNSVGNGLPLLNGAAELRINGIDVKKHTTSPTRMSEAGDLLFCIRATIGNLNISDKEYCLGRGVAALRVNNKYSKKYISLQLEALFDQMRKMSQGGVIKGLKKEEIGEFKFLIPLDKLKQEKIADIILSVENTISETQKMIDRSEKLKKSLMHQLFTKGIGHTKFKQTEIGEIPENWQVKNIGSMITHVGSGITPRGGSNVYRKSGIPLIRSQNVHFDGLRTDDMAFISPEIHSSMKRSVVFPDDVLLNITGASIGRTTVVPDNFPESNVNQHVCIIRTIRKELLPKFLCYFLQGEEGQKQIWAIQAGGNRPGLNYEQVKSIILPISHDIQEQKQIVNVLQSIDNQIAINRKLKAKQELLKQGLMQDLLTGKVVV
ncbi:MAG: EcoKI restriction-modification system protein HsdS [bacterium ADurb.Bin212]|nr:MAG: EcoKI restriction-modification system protein HsdS [bacterium ADurb.Bin212]